VVAEKEADADELALGLGDDWGVTVACGVADADCDGFAEYDADADEETDCVATADLDAEADDDPDCVTTADLDAEAEEEADSDGDEE